MNFPAVFDYNDDESAEQVADGVIVGAALSLLRRQLLLLIQQVPVKLVIVTHGVNMGIDRGSRHPLPYMEGRPWAPLFAGMNSLWSRRI